MRIPLALALAAIACAAGAEATTYRVDAARTRAEFEVDYLGVFHTHGRFGELAGRLAYDPAARAGSIMLDISAASVATDWEARDDFIRSEPIFDAARYPRAHFQSTRFEFAGDKLARVAGDLTLRGVKRAIVLDVVHIDCGGGATCVAEVTGTIRRREFGMDALWPLIGDDVELRFRIYATRE